MTVDPAQIAAIRQAISAAPDLAQYPDQTLAASNSPDPTGNAQALSVIGQATALPQAASNIQKKHPGLLDNIMGGISSATHEVVSGVEHAYQDVASSPVGHLFSSALQYASKPLSAIQHDYRYLHDLWATHDWATASLATLGVVAGTAGGAYLGGTEGAALGADLSGYLIGKGAQTGLFGQHQTDLWNKSQNQKVSFGRDLAHALGAGNTDHGLGKILSGLGDTAFDFSLDPTIKIPAFAHATRTGDLLHTRAAAALPTMQDWLESRGWVGLSTAPIISRDGTVLLDAKDRIAALGNNPNYMRALGNMADAYNNNVGKFISQFPQYSRLSRALITFNPQNADDMQHMFLALADTNELLGSRYGTLPSQTILRGWANSAAQFAKELGNTSKDQETGLLRAGLNTGKSIATGSPTLDPLTGAVAGKIRTFSQRLPYAIDTSTENGKQLLTLSGKQMNLLDPGSLNGMYQSLRFTMGEKAAQLAVGDIAVAQASGDLTSVRTAWMNAQKQMLIATGLPDDAVKTIMERTENANLDTRHYGTGYESGDAVNHVDVAAPAPVGSEGDLTATKQAAALWRYQATENSAFPNFWQIKNAMRSMDKVSRMYGALDENIAAYYTNSIFKPLALVNAGFGLRVAMAEALPASFRYGALNMLQNRLLATNAKSDYKSNLRAQLRDANAARESGDLDQMVSRTKQIMNTAAGHRLAAMSKLTGGALKLLKTDDRMFDLAHDLVEQGQGDIVWGVAQAGHGMHLEPINAVDKQESRLYLGATRVAGVRKMDKYTLFTPSMDGYAQEWHTNLANLSAEAPAQNIARDLLDHDPQTAISNETERVRNDEYNEASRMVRYDLQSPEEFAAHRVDAVRGLLTGSDGTFHTDLAEKIAQGKAPLIGDLKGKEGSLAPRDVPGLAVAPNPPEGWLQRGIQNGFKSLVDPVINHVSREPMWLQAVSDEMRPLEPLVERGLLERDTALSFAQYRATETILPQIHNVMLRSQFSAIMRNIMPFYFAQEQAIKRTAHLLTKDPEALRKYALINQGLHDTSFVNSSNGQRTLDIPFSATLSPMFMRTASMLGFPVQAGLPMSFTGNLSSLSTVLPEIKPPGVSPVLSVPLNQFAKFFPEWTPEVKGVLGNQGFGQSFKDELVPNQFFKNLFDAIDANQGDRSFANAMQQAMTAAFAHGKAPTEEELAQDPNLMQAFLDRMKNNARSALLLKGFLATFSPLSPAPVLEDPGWRQEFQNLLNKGMTYDAALAKFQAEHGSSSISYTIAKTDNKSGAYLPHTVQALDWVTAHHDFVANNISAAYLIPEQGHLTNDMTLYDEALAMGLRARETPETFLTNMYIKAGTNQYLTLLDQHKTDLAQATTPDQVTQLNQQWSETVKNLKIANPVWAADFGSPAKNVRAQEIYQNLLNVFRSGNVPDSSQNALVAELLQSYQVYSSARALAQSKKDIDGQWSQYLNQYASDHPETSNIINNVFSRLQKAF